MFLTEQQLRDGLKTITGVLVGGLTLVLAIRWYVSLENANLFISGVAALFLVLLFTVVAVRYFYNKRSSWMELAVEGLTVVGTMTLLVLIDPLTNPDTGLPVQYKKLLMLAMYLIIVTFATQFVKEEMIADERERRLLKTIHASAGVLVGSLTLFLTVRWYSYSNQALAAVLVACVLTTLTLVFFLDEVSDGLQVGIELLTILGVPCLIIWAQPNPAIDPGFGFFKRAILAVLYLVVVSFAAMFIETQKAEHEVQDINHEPPPEPDYDEPYNEIEESEVGETMIPARQLSIGMVVVIGEERLTLTSIPQVTSKGIVVSADNLTSGSSEQLTFEPDETVNVVEPADDEGEELTDDQLLPEITDYGKVPLGRRVITVR